MKIKNTIKLEDGRRVVCRVWDNGGETFDRYTACFRAYRTGMGMLLYPYIGMSRDPFHPLGFGCSESAEHKVDGPHLGGRVDFATLPEQVKKCIKQYFIN